MIVSCSCVTILKNSHSTIIMEFIIMVYNIIIILPNPRPDNHNSGYVDFGYSIELSCHISTCKVALLCFFFFIDCTSVGVTQACHNAILKINYI